MPNNLTKILNDLRAPRKFEFLRYAFRVSWHRAAGLHSRETIIHSPVRRQGKQANWRRRKDSSSLVCVLPGYY